MENQKESVQDYYSKVLKTKADLQTSACCSGEVLPDHVKPIVCGIHEEVKAKFYGCGAPIPAALEGRTILDLGSGSGRDCYIVSKLAGESGKVIGLDMTDAQIAVAEKHQDYHREKWGHAKSNITFVKGYIEDLKSADIADNSVDVVISNCVINLSPDKNKVFSEIFRVLKPGGELYFSDVFSDRRLPENIQKDPVMVGECLGGAMYFEDFRRMLADLNVKDYRIVNSSKIDLHNAKLAAMAGHVNFYSFTVRAFKLDLEDRCEDYGQAAIYKGGESTSPASFRLDDHHLFEKGKVEAVCQNTARMLSESRFSAFFEIVGDTKNHFGLFDCTDSDSSAVAAGADAGACC